MGEKIRRHMIFDGRVQGVGFRYRAYDAACSFGLTGWVRNLADGTVEMEVQGGRELIDRLVHALDSGSYVRIDRVESELRPFEAGEICFQILDA